MAKRRVAHAAQSAAPDVAFQDDRALMQDPVQRDTYLDAMARGGAKYVRANVWYGATQGGRDLSQLNSLVDAARARGLKVQATLSGTPGYGPGDRSLSAERPNAALMKEFAQRVASSERGRIDRYSIWNEPNIDIFLRGSQHDPRAAGRTYRQLYRAGYSGVKSADKGAQVLLGELASTTDTAQFMHGVLGGKPLKASGFALHPYDTNLFGMGSAPKQGGPWDINNLERVQSVLSTYAKQGKLRTAAGKRVPLYLTEFGYEKSQLPNEQAREAALMKSYTAARKAGAREMLYYQIQPTVQDPGAPPTVDPYGRTADPGRPASERWDTTVTGGDLSRFVKLLTSSR